MVEKNCKEIVSVNTGQQKHCTMNKWIKRTLIGVAAIALLLVGTLAVHIYMVVDAKPKSTGANLQLGKIDFASPIDSTTHAKASKAIYSIEGINRAYFNKEQGNLVFAYMNDGTLSHQKVYDQFMAKGDFNATLFRPSAEQLAASCPAIDKNSFTYQMGSYFEKLFASK